MLVLTNSYDDLAPVRQLIDDADIDVSGSNVSTDLPQNKMADISQRWHFEIHFHEWKVLHFD